MAEQETILHRWFEEVWNNRSEAAIDELFAEDGVANGLNDAEGNPLRGPEGFKLCTALSFRLIQISISRSKIRFRKATRSPPDAPFVPLIRAKVWDYCRPISRSNLPE